MYREWKTQHIDDQLDDVFRLAYGPGALAAATPERGCAGWSIRTVRRAPTPRTTRWPDPSRRATPYPTGHTLRAGARRMPLPARPGVEASLAADAASLRPSPSSRLRQDQRTRRPDRRRRPPVRPDRVRRALARFYIDYLWHDSLGRSDVFWGVLWAKIMLFLAFFAVFIVLAVLNLYIADRTAPKAFPANVHPYVERFHEMFGHRLRLVRYGTAAVLALFLALPARSLAGVDAVPQQPSFGIKDAQFDTDVGFYVFELPFITFVIDWLFAAMVVVLLLTLAAHLLNGGVLFASSTPSVRPRRRPTSPCCSLCSRR